MVKSKHRHPASMQVSNDTKVYAPNYTLQGNPGN